jgi:hypothetical protein
MVRVQIPTSLYGASLGKANAWVREQIAFSNPHKPMGDYKLHDDSGKSVSLSALTSGQLDAVNISGVVDTVRINPAHPADLQGFAHSPAPMFSGNLTRFIPSKITVSMWESATGEYGSFAGTQFLSRLLTEELKGHNMPDPYVQDLLNARRLHVGDSMEKVRRNPTAGEVKNAVVGLDLGPYQRANTLLQKGKMLGISSTLLDEKVQRYVNDLLDETENAFAANEGDDHGAFMSAANKFTSRYENSGALFNDFASNVFAPYLISSSSNLYALQYINQYVLPVLRNAIENQKDFSRWYLRKGRREGSGREAALRELDRHYRHIVKSMATAPGDYYYGKELSLVANPAFLFKHVGLVLLPLPTNVTTNKPSKEDGMRLKRLAALFIQAGNPPEYNSEGGIKVVGVEGFRKGGKRSPVEYVDRDVFSANIKEAGDRQKYLSGFKEVITTLADRIDRREGAYSSHVLVTTANAMAQKSLEDLYTDIDEYPALYYLDLVGIRPIPTNWPEKLIFAMMEVTASYRDRISGLGKDFNFTDFLTPSGIMMTGGSVSYTSENLKNEDAVKAHIRKMQESGEVGGSYNKDKWGKTENVDAQVTFLKGVLATVKATTGKDLSGTNISKAITNWEADKADPVKLKAVYTEIKVNTLTPYFLLATNTSQFGYKDMGDTPSVYKIIGETVKTSISKYGYEPTGDDVKFVTLLLYYCLRNMKLNDEIKRGFIQEMLAEFKAARETTFNEAVDGLGKKVDSAVAGAGSGDLSRLVALKAARELLIESGAKEKGELFGGVRSNPAMTREDSNLMLKKLNQLIKAEEDRLRGDMSLTASTLDEVTAFAKTLFDDQIREKMKTNDFTVSVLGSDVDTTARNMRELIDKQVNALGEGVSNLLKEATGLLADINKEGSKKKVTSFVGNLKALNTALDLYSNLGDLYKATTSEFSRGSDGYREEREYFDSLTSYTEALKKLYATVRDKLEPASKKHDEYADWGGDNFTGFERILIEFFIASEPVVKAEMVAIKEVGDVNFLRPGLYDYKDFDMNTHFTALREAVQDFVSARLPNVERNMKFEKIWDKTYPQRVRKKDGSERYPNWKDAWQKQAIDSMAPQYRAVVKQMDPSRAAFGGLMGGLDFDAVFFKPIAEAMSKSNKLEDIEKSIENYRDSVNGKYLSELDSLQKEVTTGEKRERNKRWRKDKAQGFLQGVKDKATPGTLSTAGMGTAGTGLSMIGGASALIALPAFATAAGIVTAVKGFQGLVNQVLEDTNKRKSDFEESQSRLQERGRVLGEADAKKILEDAEASKKKSLAEIAEAEAQIQETERVREQNQIDTEAEKNRLNEGFVSLVKKLDNEREEVLADYREAVDYANSIIKGTVVQISQFDARPITPNTYDDFETALTYTLTALPEDQHEAVKDEAKAMKATMAAKLRAAGDDVQAQKFEDLDVEAF